MKTSIIFSLGFMVCVAFSTITVAQSRVVVRVEASRGTPPPVYYGYGNCPPPVHYHRPVPPPCGYYRPQPPRGPHCGGCQPNYSQGYSHGHHNGHHNHGHHDGGGNRNPRRY